MLKTLRLPPDRLEIESLEAGDEVLLSGEMITLRDAALGRLEKLDAAGARPPFSIEGALVFHAGPSPAAAGRPCGSIGPTTAARMDSFLELLFRYGALATLGKGPRGEEAPALHARHRRVYFAAVGGVAALFGGMALEIERLAWEDLGPEAVNRVLIEGMPAAVAIDSRGREHLAARYLRYRREME